MTLPVAILLLVLWQRFSGEPCRLPELEKSIGKLKAELDHLRRDPEGTGRGVPPESVSSDTRSFSEAPRLEAKLREELESRSKFLLTIQSFPKTGSLWGRDATVEVCWESMDASQANQRDLVRKAIADTWESVASVRFEGWEGCQVGKDRGIHISVQDEAPRTRFLGRGLAGIEGGMVLNFEYRVWGAAVCRTMVERCMRATAIHEFGHALGFSHEQNRPDTPSWCNELPQGDDGDVELLQWDPDSIMNYCREGWRTGTWKEPWLSKGDVEAVQYLYGKRS